MTAGLLVVSLTQSFLVKVYRVPSGSMERTLQGSQAGGDRILVNRLSQLSGRPTPGDVVVFARPESWRAEEAASRSAGVAAAARVFGDLTGIGPSNEEYLVKRIIAVGGQKISCCGADGRLLVDGKPIDEPYVFEDVPFVAGRVNCDSSPRSARCFPEFTVPEDELFVLGDHRSQSSDSVAACRSQARRVDAECVKTVSTEAVIGTVIGRLWPLDRLGGLG